MQYFRFWIRGFVPFSLLTWVACSFCLGQGVGKIEDALPQELRNRSDVELLVQKLRFLRKSDSSMGEMHPSKKFTQAKISDCEAALTTIVEQNSLPQAAVSKSSENLEDSVPKELFDRPEVELIIQKLRFLRKNESNFGEKHPNKKSTQLQIRENELALNTILEEDSLKSPKPVVAANLVNIEDSLSQELRKREDVNLLVRQLLYLRINLTSFRDNHPDRKTVQEQLQKQESALLAIVGNIASRMRSTKGETSLMRALEDRKEVQVLVHKLTILRLSEATYGEEDSKMKSIKTEIRKHEASLIEIIELDQPATKKSNSFPRSRDNESR